MVPVVSILKFSSPESDLKLMEGIGENRQDQFSVVVVRDTGVLGISADVDHLAAIFKQAGWKH